MPTRDKIAIAALLYTATVSAQITGPSISTTSYSGFIEGSADCTLVIDGAGFVAGSVARLDATRLVTNLISPARLVAAVPATLLAKAGSPLLTVVNPSGVVSPQYQMGVGPPTPGIILSPNFVPAGGGAFTLTINGQNFLPQATIDWNNTSTVIPTSVTSNKITATIPAALTGAPGVVQIWVNNVDANRNGATSNNASLHIGIPVPSNLPVMTSYSPAFASYLGPDVTLTVNGANFDKGATIRWNGRLAATTWVSSGQLTATISTAQQTPCCVMGISVVNSNAAESDYTWFPLNAAPAAVLDLVPSSVSAVAGPFSLTVRGYGFNSGAQVRWNNTGLTTTFVDSTQLTATVPTSLLTAGPATQISVSTAGYTTGRLPLSVSGPSVYPGGVVNGASSLAVVAPGSLVSIYGTNFAAGTSVAGGFPLPTTLGGTSVTLNGAAVPLLFVSPTQINAQIPYEAGSGTASLIVRAGNIASTPAPVALSASAPGIYTAGITDHAIAVNLPEGTLNSSVAPAAPGQYVTLYLTGQGAVQPFVDTGTAAPLSDLSVPVASTEVLIDGAVAGHQFAGLAPGFAGLMQINLQIPEISPGEHRLQVRIGGIKSNDVAISVKAR